MAGEWEDMKELGADKPAGGMQAPSSNPQLTKTLSDIEKGVPPQYDITWNGKDFPEFKKPSRETLKAMVDEQQSGWEDLPKASKTELPVPAGREPTKLGKGEDWGSFLSDSARKGWVGLITGPAALSAGFSTMMPWSPFKQRDVQMAEDFTNWVKKFANVKDVEPPKDATGKTSKSAEYLGKAIEFSVSGVIPSGFVIKAAERKVLAAALEAVGTTAGAMGAVEGKTWGRDAFKAAGLDPKRGAIIGETLFSVAGPTSVGTISNWLTKGGYIGGKVAAEGGISGLSRESQTEAAKKMVSEEVRSAVMGMPGAKEKLAESAKISSALPGFEPTIAQATGSPELRAITTGMMERSSGAFEKGAMQQARMEEAIAKGQESMFPVGAIAPEIVAGRRLGVQQKNAADTLQSIDNQIRAIANKVGRSPQADVGAELRALRDQKEAAIRKVSDAKYADAYALAKKEGVAPNMSTVAADMKQILGDQATRWQDKPGVIGEVLRAYSKEAKTAPKIINTPRGPITLAGRETAQAPKTVSVEEFHSLYKRTNKELGEAYLAKDWDKYNALKELKGSLGRQITVLETTGGRFGQIFKDANQFYGREIIEKFQKGLGGKMDNTGKFGEITRDEEVVKKLINNPTGMKEFFGIYGEDQKALGTLTRGLTDDFSRAVVKNGQIDVTAARNYLRNNKEVLDALPELKQKLASRTEMTNTLLARRQQVVAEKRALDKSELAKFFRAQDPETGISKAMESPQQLEQVVSAVKNNPQASTALARTIAENLANRPNPLEYLVSNEKTMKPLMDQLGKGHYDNLKILAGAREITGRVKLPNFIMAPEVKGLVETLTGTSMRGWVAALSPRSFATSTQDRVVNLGSRFVLRIKEAEATKLREAAMFDTDLAKVMAEISEKGATKERYLKLQHHMFSQGIKAGASTSQEPDVYQSYDTTPPEESIAAKYKREHQR